MSQRLPLALALVVTGASCQAPTPPDEGPAPLALGPIVPGAPPSGQPAGQLRAVPVYSAARVGPAVATLAAVRARAAAAGVDVASIDTHRGVPTFIWGDAAAASAVPAVAAREHLTALRGVYQLPEAAVDATTVKQVHDIGRGAIVVKLGQEVSGVEVYRSQMSVVMSRDNRLIAMTGNLHPAARPAATLPTLDMSPDEALDLAVDDASGGNSVDVLTHRVKTVLYPLRKSLEPAQVAEFEIAPSGSTASRAYRYVIAGDGRILERVNETFSEAFDYRVWADNSGRPLDGPIEDFTPNPDGAPGGDNAGFIAPAIHSMEGFNTNPDGGADPWLAANATTTTGNNVDAYADISGEDGFDASDIRVSLTGTREFDHTYDTSQSPQANEQTEAAITQLFYTTNWLHDYFYDSGFNEAAGNAQADNFGRGGVEGDRMHAEAHDFSGTDNANMSTPEDGMSPTMQMYLFTGGIGRDGAIDNTVVSHEWGHYFHHRLSSCESTLQCAAMSEGWGDFMSIHEMVREGDDLSGTFAGGIYVTGDPYFGIRRYPYSTDKTKNPLTFKHIGQSATLPSGPPRSFDSNHAEVHNAGEIWATMLTEAYFALLNEQPRLTFAEAQRRMADYLVAGLLAAPVDNTFTEMRDSILAAAAANDPQDAQVMAEAFARRGAGTGAQSPPRDSQTLDGVVESFDLASDLAVAQPAIAEANDCDDDGNWDGGETATLTIHVTNPGGKVLTDTSVEVSTTHAGVSFPDGASVTVPEIGAYVTKDVEVAIELADDLTDADQVQFDVTVQNSDALTPSVSTQLFRHINVDDVAASSATDDVESSVTPWTANNEVGDSFEWARAQLDGKLETVWHADDAGALSDQTLQSPALEVGTDPLVISFDHRFSFEADDTANWDGGVIEISTDGGTSWQDVGDAAGYGGPITDQAGNPLATRQAFVGDSPSYPEFTSASVDLGTAFANMSVMIRFRVGSDEAVGAPGWDIDNVSVSGITNTPFSSLGADQGVCDNSNPDNPDGNPEDGGCGCQSTSGGAGGSLLILLALGLALRRRRRDPAVG